MMDIFDIFSILTFAFILSAIILVGYNYNTEFEGVNFERIDDLDIINIDGGERRFKRMCMTINMLPDNVLNLMKEKKLRIVFSKNKRPVGNGKYAGVYWSGDEYIYIWDNGVLGNSRWINMSIIHEIGHFVDYQIGERNFNSCIDTDFHRICMGESKYYEKYSGDYFTSNIKEYFAQSFAEYFLTDDFKVCCENTTMYIEEILI